MRASIEEDEERETLNEENNSLIFEKQLFGTDLSLTWRNMYLRRLA